MALQYWMCPHCKEAYVHVDALLRHIKIKHPSAPRRKR